MINAIEANDLMPSTQEFQACYNKYMNIIEEKIIDTAKKDQRAIAVLIPPRLKYSIMAALEEAYYECEVKEPVIHDGVYVCPLTIFWGA